VLQCVAVCVGCVAMCCSVLQCVVVCVRSRVEVLVSALTTVSKIYCSVLQCVAVCCSVLRCVAVC